MRTPLTILFSLLLLSSTAVQAGSNRAAHASDGQVGVVLGHQQTFDLNFPAFFPWVEVRLGYQVTENFLGRVDLGMGASRVTNSDNQAFEGGTLLNANVSLALLYTPQLSDDLYLCLGGMVGPWFTALWGDNLAGLSGSAGTNVKYLEQTVFSYGAVLGLEWNLAPRWAMQFEARYNLALAPLGGRDYNLGGLGVFIGFLYRMSAYHTEMPK